MNELPNLPYEYNALEPHIDELTMKIHHTKHHQAYIDNLNKAVAGTELEGKDVNEILADFDSVPSNIQGVVRNHGGGHSNHSMFWTILAPEGQTGECSEELKAAVTAKFGTCDAMKEEFSKAAMTRFGSGWAWLVVNNGELEIMSTANQDSPIMEGKKPILGIDVWEHSYYLKYQQNRAEYLTNVWKIINWAKVSENFEKAK